MSEENFGFHRDFQREILSCLAQDKKFLRESIGLLKPEYFDNRLHMLAAKAIYKVYVETQEVPSKVSLLQYLSDSFSKIVRVKDKMQEKRLVLRPVEKLLRRVFKPLNGSQLIVKRETLKFCKIQEFKRTLLESFEGIEKDNDIEKASEFISKRFRNINTLDISHKELGAYIDKLPMILTRDRSRCITTGYPTLDKWMNGGMDPGTLTVFIAPSKFGKSMALVNVGYNNMIRGKVVLHFTLEISEDKILVRYASRISRVRANKISVRQKRVTRRVLEFHKRWKGKLFVKGYPTKGATVETLKSYIYSFINRNDIKPDVIIVDYGDLLRSANVVGKTGDNERMIQGDVYEGLRAMAAEFDCPVVTASQCNRQAASKTIIRMEDIAESYQKCQVADHVIAICGTEEERKVNSLRLFFAGSREARTGKALRVRFRWPIASMVEVRDEELAKEEAE